MAVDWPGIAAELVQLIAEMALKNGSLIDVMSMAAVCNWWRKCLLHDVYWPIHRTVMAVSRADRLPMLMLPEMLPNAAGDPNDDRDYFHPGLGIDFQLHLPELRGSRCCGSGYGWLVMARDDDLMIRLVNPLTRQQIQLPGIPYIRVDDGVDIYELEIYEYDGQPFMTNAIVIGDPSKSREDYTVVAVIFGHLFCLVNGRDAKMWSRLTTRETPTRMAHDRGVVYCFADEDIHDVEACDLSTGRLLWFGEWRSPIPGNLLYEYHHFRSYLIQVSDGDIYLASRPLQLEGDPPPEGHSLVVFRLYLRPKRWVQLTDLGNRCLFLGDNTSMVLSPVPRNSGYRRNHVYFTRSCIFPPETRAFDWCAYDFGRGTYQRFSFANAAAYSLTPSLWVGFNPGRAAWI